MSMFVRVSHSETTHIMINNTQQCITRPLSTPVRRVKPWVHGPATSPNNLPRLHTKQDDEAKANAWLDANADVAALWFDAPDRQAGTTGRVGA